MFLVVKVLQEPPKLATEFGRQTFTLQDNEFMV